MLDQPARAQNPKHMAAINDFSDILSAMERNPELQEAMRNHVLGAELRQLPAVVQQQGELLVQVQDRLRELASTLRDTTEQIASYALVSSRVITTTVERLDHVEADLAELKAAQVRLEAIVREIREIQARMENDIAELKTDVAELKTDMAEVKADVVELKTEQATTNRRLNRIEGQLGNLNGWRLESDVHKNISSIVHRYLMLQGTYVLKSGILPQSNELDSILRQARTDGRITRDQVQEVLDTDMIVTAEDDDDQKYVIAAEVAHTLDDRDITRAAQRSRIMADAMQIDGIAIAIAPRIAPQQRELAASEGVTVVQIPDANTAPQRPSDWTASE